MHIYIWYIYIYIEDADIGVIRWIIFLYIYSLSLSLSPCLSLSLSLSLTYIDEFLFLEIRRSGPICNRRACNVLENSWLDSCCWDGPALIHLKHSTQALPWASPWALPTRKTRPLKIHWRSTEHASGISIYPAYILTISRTLLLRRDELLSCIHFV